MMSWTRKKLFVGQETLPPQFISCHQSNSHSMHYRNCGATNWNTNHRITNKYPILYIFPFFIYKGWAGGTALDYLPVKLRVSPVYKISADFLPAGLANKLPYISQIFYVGGGFSRPTLHPAHHISANFQRTKQLFVQQKEPQVVNLDSIIFQMVQI